MAEGQRPGGLTALAVLNFIFGGLAAIGLLLMVVAGGLVSAVDTGDPDAETVKHTAVAFLAIMGLVMAVQAFLLIASGVGYLQQKRVLGRYLGNAYAIIALLGVVVTLGFGEEFTLGTIIGLIYPIVTLALLNTTFKEDLVY